MVKKRVQPRSVLTECTLDTIRDARENSLDYYFDVFLSKLKFLTLLFVERIKKFLNLNPYKIKRISRNLSESPCFKKENLSYEFIA